MNNIEVSIPDRNQPIVLFCNLLKGLGLGSLAHNLHRASLPREWKHLARLGWRYHLRSHGSHGNGYELLEGNKRLAPVWKIAPGSASKQRAWLIASGPSLARYDLSFLSDEDVFAVNGSIIKLEQDGVTPVGSIAVDQSFFSEHYHLVRKALAISEHCYFSSAGIFSLASRAPEMLAGKQIHLLDLVSRHAGYPNYSRKYVSTGRFLESQPFSHTDGNNKRVGWSENPNMGVFAGGTVVFAALQLLKYLGYKEVNILGMDMNYDGNRPRFYETRKNMTPTAIASDLHTTIVPAFSIIERLRMDSDFLVRNVTTGSGLPNRIIPWTHPETVVPARMTGKKGSSCI